MITIKYNHCAIFSLKHSFVTTILVGEMKLLKKNLKVYGSSTGVDNPYRYMRPQTKNL